MSVSNILSDTGPADSQPQPPAQPVAPPAVSPERSMREPIKPYIAPQPAGAPEPYPAPAPINPAVPDVSIKRETNGDGVAAPIPAANYPTGPPGLTVEATEEAFAEIERQELSDLDTSEFETPLQAYMEMSRKRTREVDQKENMRRKVCRHTRLLTRCCC